MKPPPTPSQPLSTRRSAFSVLALVAMVLFGRDACLCGGGGGNRPPPGPESQPTAPPSGSAIAEPAPPAAASDGY